VIAPRQLPPRPPRSQRNALSPLLAARGWTDRTLAARAGLDRTHVNQLKNGRALPTVASALAVARALGLPVGFVFPPRTSDRRRPKFSRTRSLELQGGRPRKRSSWPTGSGGIGGPERA
jgi:transcriptional regulator with XRE-family HTH domain